MGLDHSVINKQLSEQDEIYLSSEKLIQRYGDNYELFPVLKYPRMLFPLPNVTQILLDVKRRIPKINNNNLTSSTAKERVKNKTIRILESVQEYIPWYNVKYRSKSIGNISKSVLFENKIRENTDKENMWNPFNNYSPFNFNMHRNEYVCIPKRISVGPSINSRSAVTSYPRFINQVLPVHSANPDQFSNRSFPIRPQNNSNRFNTSVKSPNIYPDYNISRSEITQQKSKKNPYLSDKFPSFPRSHSSNSPPVYYCSPDTIIIRKKRKDKKESNVIQRICNHRETQPREVCTRNHYPPIATIPHYPNKITEQIIPPDTVIYEQVQVGYQTEKTIIQPPVQKVCIPTRKFMLIDVGEDASPSSNCSILSSEQVVEMSLNNTDMRIANNALNLCGNNNLLQSLAQISNGQDINIDSNTSDIQNMLTTSSSS